jgi:hypothetical protein
MIGTVERKTFENFVASLSDGTLAIQMQRLGEVAREAGRGRGTLFGGSDGEPGLGLDHPAGPEPGHGPPGRGMVSEDPDPRPGHQVLRPFEEVVRSEGMRIIKTPIRAPRANAYAERWVRTVRVECLDWMLIVGRRHLARVLRAYVVHYG